MKWFRGLNIKTKFIVAFSALMVPLLMLILFAIVQMNIISEEYRNTINHPVMAREAVLRFESYSRAFRRTVASLVMYAPVVHDYDILSYDIGDLVDNIRDEAQDFFELAMLALSDYDYAISTNERYTPVEIITYLALSADLRRLIQEYYDNIYVPVLAYVYLGDHPNAVLQVREGASLINQMTNTTDILMQSSEYLMDYQVRSAYYLAESGFRLIIVLSVVVFFLTIVFIMSIANSIAKPIRKLTELTNNITTGKLNVNMDRSQLLDNEIGKLTADMYALVEVIKNIDADFDKLHHEFMKNGDIDYRLDEHKYDNAYKELMHKVNSIFSSLVQDMITAITSVDKIAKGDFDIEINDLPGKKIILPQAIRAIAESLNDLYTQMHTVSRRAAKGDFSLTIDQAQFSGKWASLVRRLNMLIEAVADPLAEIENNVILMSKGDFSRLDKDYPGTFGVLVDACNLVNDITEAYVSEISDSLERIAGGDLTVELKQTYIGSYSPIETALATILSNLNQTMSDVQGAVDNIAMGAQQISENASNLAEGASMQTSAIHELGESITLIHDKAIQANNNATRANDNTALTKEHVATGDHAIKSLASTMELIKASSESIAKINDVITGISFQTNLLALNASVEAARAGEHGKGFSVVAEEVRNLAGRSQKSVGETAEIVREDLDHVANGIKAMNEVLASFETISNNVSEISNLISDISNVSTEQMNSISGINDSVSQIAGVVTNTSATAEESAAASEELSAQADVLRNRVAFFKLRTD